MSKTIFYEPPPTAKKLHENTSFVRGLLGPIGTGKSVSCCMEILRGAMAQEPHTDNVRYSRAIITRNTYQQLLNTTIKTWLQWIPEEMGVFRKSVPITHHLNFPMADGTIVDCEVVFLSLESEEDVKKLKSLEVTFIWMNELSELGEDGKVLLENATGRLKRYPNDALHGQYSRSWLIFDSNMPPADERNWLYKMLEIDKPKNHAFFFQPPAIRYNEDTKQWEGHPDAENVENHKEGYDYWLSLVPGKSDQYIAVMLEGKYGVLKGGRPVYETVYDHKYHTSETEIEADRDFPVLLGMDWGLYPAIVFGQITRGGTLKLLKEMAPDEPTSLEELLEDEFTAFIQKHFRGCRFEGWGDPAGINRSSLDKRTPYQICNRFGIRVTPTYSNDPIIRRDAVVHFLKKKDGMKINPSMAKIRMGFLSKYAYEKLKTSDGYKDKPEKNLYSHPHDALQYLCLGLRHPYKPLKSLVEGRKSGVAA